MAMVVTLCSLITVMENIERIMDQMIMFVIVSQRVDFVQFYYLSVEFRFTIYDIQCQSN